MTKILNVQSSPNLQGSASRAISAAFIESLIAANSNATVETLDLATNPPSHYSPSHLGAFFGPPETHGPEQHEAISISDTYIDQLIASDIVVLGTPIHNFGVASTMKSWIDHILRAGRTFQYTETGPVGLLSDIRVVVAVGSGGVYSEGPMAAMEHCGNYLRDIMAITGLTDTTILRAEAQAMGPEAAADGLARGKAEAEALAATMA